VPQAHAAEPPPPGARPRAISGQNGPVSSYRGALWPPAAGPGVGRVGGNRSSPLYSCPRLAPPRAPSWRRRRRDARTAAVGMASDSDGDDGNDGIYAWFIKPVDAKATELDADLETTFLLPWCASGSRSGPNSSWQCLQAVLRTQGTADGSEEVEPRALEICAYKTAITTQGGQEFWCFAVVVTEAPRGTEGASQTHTSLRCMEVTQHRRRGRAPSGKSAGVGRVRPPPSTLRAVPVCSG